MSKPPRAPKSSLALTPPTTHCALTLAMGQALALIASTLHRNGVASAHELSEVLSHLAAAGPSSDETRILGVWAAMMRESASAIEAAGSMGPPPRAH